MHFCGEPNTVEYRESKKIESREKIEGQSFESLILYAGRHQRDLEWGGSGEFQGYPLYSEIHK